MRFITESQSCFGHNRHVRVDLALSKTNIKINGVDLNLFTRVTLILSKDMNAIN